MTYTVQVTDKNAIFRFSDEMVAYPFHQLGLVKTRMKEKDLLSMLNIKGRHAYQSVIAKVEETNSAVLR